MRLCQASCTTATQLGWLATQLQRKGKGEVDASICLSAHTFSVDRPTWRSVPHTRNKVPNEHGLSRRSVNGKCVTIAPPRIRDKKTEGRDVEKYCHGETHCFIQQNQSCL